VDGPDHLEVVRVDEVDAGAHHVTDRGADTAQRLLDDLEAAAGLGPHIGVDLAAVLPLGCGAGHEDPLAHPHGAAVADGQLPG
jgi:hypothetical protein